MLPLAKHFRTTSDRLPAKYPTLGLRELHLIGSGQFSASGLAGALQRFPDTKFTVIDLRQESHGFLDGHAIDVFHHDILENVGKSPAQIESIQAHLLANLTRHPATAPYVLQITSDNTRLDKSHSTYHPVHGVLSEKTLVHEYGQDYERVYVQNYTIPEDAEVDRFLSVLRQIPSTHWIYFHCRAGVGRTTLFMAMVDMLHNAKQLSFDEIIARQHAIGGKNLLQLPRPDSFKYTLNVARIQFLRDFYHYAREEGLQSDRQWQDWHKTPPPTGA